MHLACSCMPCVLEQGLKMGSAVARGVSRDVQQQKDDHTEFIICKNMTLLYAGFGNDVISRSPPDAEANPVPVPLYAR